MLSFDGGALGFRNIVHNAEFVINQRTVSGTVSLSAGAFGHDRWKAGASGCTYTFATSNGLTTLTITAGSLQQVIEDKSVPPGTNTMVMSWSGTAQGKIGAGSYSASGVSASVAGGSNLTIEFGTGTLTKVQLELGTSVTPFDRRPYGLEDFLCKRFYWRLPAPTVGQNLGMGFCETTTRARPMFYLPAPMRTTPNIGYSAAGDFTLRGTTTNVTCTSLTAVGLSNQTFAIEANTGSAHGGVAGGCASLNALLTTSWIDASADL